MARAENAVVAACLQLLEFTNIPAWRNNSGAMKFGGRFVRFGATGSPDIFAIVPPGGRLLGCECKTAAGRQTQSQKDFQAAMERAGAVYVLARSVDDLMGVLRAMGVIG
jgi:hypothetical protein